MTPPPTLAPRAGAALQAPHWLVDAVGPFDLDPCAPTEPQAWSTAARCIAAPTATPKGLREPWSGTVWLNPPHATRSQWLARLAHHCDGGIALTPAQPEAKWFAEHVWAKASAVIFIYGRLHLSTSSGGSSGRASRASALIAYGDECAARLRKAVDRGAIEGVVISGWDAPRRQLRLFDEVTVERPEPVIIAASGSIHGVDHAIDHA